MCGTTDDYFAPEMVRQSAYDYSADIWSIGVLTYELLVGRPPFEIPDYFEYPDNIDRTIIDFPEYVQSDAREFIQFILQKDPSQRPKLDEIEKHAWLKRNN